MQFRIIVATDPPTRRQDRLQYTAPQLARSIIKYLTTLNFSNQVKINAAITACTLLQSRNVWLGAWMRRLQLGDVESLSSCRHHLLPSPGWPQTDAHIPCLPLPSSPDGSSNVSVRETDYRRYRR